MAEGLILPDANQILLLTADGLQRCTIKTGSAVACISSQADLSFGYKAKD